MSNSNIHKSVMRRIYAVWLLKKLASPFAVKSYILILLLLQSLTTVSLPNVIQNAPSPLNLSASFNFFSTALLHTELLVQALFFGILLLGLWLMRDLLLPTHSRQLAS